MTERFFIFAAKFTLSLQTEIKEYESIIKKIKYEFCRRTEMAWHDSRHDPRN